MNFPSKKIMPRFSLISILFILACAAVVVKAFCVMTIERKEWNEKRKAHTYREYSISPLRGDILASDGRILATMMPQYDVTIDFCTYERTRKAILEDQHRRDTAYLKHKDEIVAGVYQIFPDIDTVKYNKYLDSCFYARARGCPAFPQQVSTISYPKGQKRNRLVSYMQLCELRKLPLFKYWSSVGAHEVKVRNMPHGRLAGLTIGLFKDSARYGIEKAYDSILAGKPGRCHNEKVRNKIMSVVDQPVENGLDVMTTLDIDMQDICHQTLVDEMMRLNADSGNCILMDVTNGDVKAIVSLRKRKNGQGYEEGVNYSLCGMQMPGSVFKPCSFMVAMDDGRIKMTDGVTIQSTVHTFSPGNNIKDDHAIKGAKWQNVLQIIEGSLNTGTSIMIWNHYKDDPQAFIDGVERVGMSADLKLPLRAYHKPYVASPKDKRRHWANVWDLPRLSIGYSSQIPPINIVNFYAGIANNGKLFYPRFIKGYMKNGQMVQEFPPQVLRKQMAKPEVIAYMQDALRAVVQTGTAHGAASKYVPFSGKTGTANMRIQGIRYNNVTFVGYFPSYQPRYALIVNMQKPSPAYGNMCAHAFRIIAERIMARNQGQRNKLEMPEGSSQVPYLQAGNIMATSRSLQSLGIPFICEVQKTANNVPVWGRPQMDATQPHLMKTEATDSVVPDVTGYGLRDAVYRLESLGLRVQVKGQGTVVLQSLAAGTTIKKGTRITLTLSNERKKKNKPVAPAAPKAPTAAPSTPSAAKPAGSAV